MGHRFSKTAANNIATSTAISEAQKTTTTNTLQQQQQSHTGTTRRIPIPNSNNNNNFVGPTINFQIQESPTATTTTTAATCCNTSSTAVTAPNNILQHHQLSTGGGGCANNDSSSGSLTSVNNLSCGRQIIIKIQLAKMENGNEMQQAADSSFENLTSDCTFSPREFMTTTTASAATSGGAQFLNLTLNSSSSGTTGCSSNNMSNTSAAATNLHRTAGSSTSSATTSASLASNNNYLNPCSGGNQHNTTSSTNYAATAATMDGPTMALTERLGRLNTLQFNDEIVEQNIGEIVEYCEVLEDHHHQLAAPPIPPSSSGGGGGGGGNNIQAPEEAEVDTNVCCRRKSKSLAANGGATSATAKRRCRKCSCRDAFRRILDPSLSRSSNKASKLQQLERKEQNKHQNQKAQERHSISNPLSNNRSLNHPIMASMTMPQRNSIHSTLVVPQPPPKGATAAAMMAAAAAAAASTSASAAAVAAAAPNQVAVWAPVTTTNGSDVIIPLSTPPQFVVVQCAIVSPPLLSTSAVASSPSPSILPTPNSIISIAHDPLSSAASSSTISAQNADIMVKVPVAPNRPHRSLAPAAPMVGPIVHSHVDFVHYLVPDLERITNSSFYWGKMDRYEAERLLEGKPEGTFLLRDSAQEEFLFSVTFRKYGRSLHARIEQSGHQFSFDCHDPCVFTAPTVTGLLEHYKDPACVMFFEPMLTIPLHRKNCFSLQQLCRATIVSNTTYDGINELELPARLKSYLKEYHYKQKLRVKLNEPTYTTHCK